MDEDIDIYEDLSSFNVESDVKAEKDKDCKCEELRKEVSELINRIQDVEKINKNLERNLSSLLKTAKVEVARKDRIIEDLRNQLDNRIFKRNVNVSNPASISSYQQKPKMEKYESVTPLVHSEELEFNSLQVESYHGEYKSRKPKNDVQVPVTVFGERLQKKIMESKMEEKKQITSSKLDTEANTNDIRENCIVESDKENGSECSTNNTNESNTITQNSTSGTLHRKNTGKRLNDEDNTCRSKRLKNMDNVDNEDKNDVPDYNYTMQYETKDNITEYRKVTDNIANSEDRATAVQSFQKDQTPFDAKRKTISKHEETKQTRNYGNRWKSEERNDSEINYDVSRTRRSSMKSCDSLKDFRVTSKSSNRSNSESQHDYYNGYNKNNYKRSSPNFRSNSRRRNDYESSSSHCLRDNSSRTYKNKKYDDYKYDRYKDSRSKWDHDSKKSNYYRTRHNSRYRDDVRNKLRPSSCEVEYREDRSNSYKNNKQFNYRIKRAGTSDLDSRRLHKNKFAAVMDSLVSSSGTVVDTAADRNIKKNTEQLHVENKPSTFIPPTENTSVNTTMADTNSLEEGEILYSPKKEDNSADVFEKKATIENVKKIVSVESTNESVPADIFENNTLISCQNNTDDTKQVERVTETDIEKTETALSFQQENSEETVVENIATNDEKHNNNDDSDTCKPCFLEDVIDPIIQNAVIAEEVYVNNNDDDSCKNCVDENLGDPVIAEGAARFEEVSSTHNESITKSEETSNSVSAVKIEKINNPNIDDISDTDCVRKSNSDESRSNSPRDATKVEVTFNCDIEDKNTDKNQVYDKLETSQQILDKNNVEVSRSCFNDHNYIRNIATDASDLGTIQESLVRSEHRQIVKETATSKVTKTEKTIVQSADVKKAVASSTVKNKKDQQSKTIVISRRRKAVKLSDNSASMTILINKTNATKASVVANDTNINNKNDSLLKPRACKFARAVKAPCK